jgi:hypothetical protein
VTEFIRQQGVLITPEPHHDVDRQGSAGYIAVTEQTTEPIPGSLESLRQYQQKINTFLEKNRLRNLFNLAELPILPDGAMVLLSPEEMMAVMVEDEAGKMHVRHCPRLFKEMLDWQGLKYTEVPYVQPIGHGLAVVSFPMNPGPPAIGEKPQELLMSMLMEQADHQLEEPTIVIGSTTELQELSAQAPKFEPVRITQAEYNALAEHYSQLEKQFGGKQAPLSPALIGETSNIDAVDQFSASRNFFSILTFHMKDGSIRTRLVNRGEIDTETNELQEATCYVITTKIDGEQHVVVAKIRRLNGQITGYEDTAYEVIRGFNRRPLQKKEFRHQLGTGESGISGEDLLKYQVNGKEVLESDGDLEDVNATVVEINLPDNISFALENKQVDEPTKPVEQLVPSWMKMSDALQAIRDGEVFTDAFSIALLASWFCKHAVVSLKEITPDGQKLDQLSIALKIVQDWRSGGEKYTIWRESAVDKHINRGSYQQLSCNLIRNSGIHKNNQRLGFVSPTHASQVMSEATESWTSVPLVEFFAGIATRRWDNVTIAAGFKTLLQLNYLEYDLKKLT